MPQPLLVYITMPDPESARSLAAALVKERLAACANVLHGIESWYWWQGKIATGTECLCLCKCLEEGYPALESRIRELHPYEVPCIAALPIVQGHGPFLQWIAGETRRP